MLKYILIFFLTLKPASSSNLLFTDTEFQIAVDLVKNLKIRHCILIGPKMNDPKIISLIKRFSAEELPSVYLNYQEATHYIDASVVNERNYYGTAILFHKEALSGLQKISTYIKDNYMKSFAFRFYTWLIFTQNVHLIKEQNFNIPYNCEFIAIEKEEDINYKLTEIYQVKGNIFALDFGTWSHDFGLDIPDQTFYWRRINVNGSSLELVVLDGIDCPTTFAGCLLDEVTFIIAHKMNFSLQRMSNIPAPEFSDKGIGDILNSLQPYNTPRMKILGPVLNTELPWYIKDQRTGLRPDYYLQPFETSVWLALFFSAVLLTIFCLMMNNYIHTRNKRNWIDDIFIGFESLCDQCGNDHLQNVSLRFAFLSLQITVIVVASAYGAVITSFLAVQKLEIPFRNVEEFSNNRQNKLGAEENSYEAMILAGFKAELFPNNLMKKIFDENYTVMFNETTASNFFEKFCSENYAVTGFYDTIISYKINCNLIRHPEPLLTLINGLYHGLYSPFVEAFNILFLRLYLESGIKNRHQNNFDTIGDQNSVLLALAFGIQSNDSTIDYTKIPSTLEQTEDVTFHFVKFPQIVHILSIPFIGIVMGIFILFGELVYEKGCQFWENCKKTFK